MNTEETLFARNISWNTKFECDKSSKCEKILSMQYKNSILVKEEKEEEKKEEWFHSCSSFHSAHSTCL